MNIELKKDIRADEFALKKGARGHVVGHQWNDKGENRYVVNWQVSGVPPLSVDVGDVEIIK